MAASSTPGSVRLRRRISRSKHRFLGSGSVNVRLGIVRHRQPGLHRHHPVGIETELHLEQIPETAQQKPRRHHQHQRERQFPDHQHAARARALPGASGAAPFLPERASEIKTARQPRGSKAEDDSGSDRDEREQTPARSS